MLKTETYSQHHKNVISDIKKHYPKFFDMRANTCVINYMKEVARVAKELGIDIPKHRQNKIPFIPRPFTIKNNRRNYNDN